MKHVRLTFRAPPGTVHPVFDALTRGEFVDSAEGLHWNFSGDRLGILHYVEADRERYVAEVESIPSVLDYDVAAAGEDEFYVYHRCRIDDAARDLWATFTDGSLLLVPPVEFGSDGRCTLSLFGDRAEVGATVDALPDHVEVEVHEVGGMASTPEVTGATLTDRQREAVETAFALGYYEIPRAAGHEAVAEAIDCAPSTAAEHLRKAEAKLLRSVLDGA